MAKHNCEKCGLRAKYDNNANSIIGRLWKWHINWCPGWKGYMASLPVDEKTALVEKYNLKK